MKDQSEIYRLFAERVTGSISARDNTFLEDLLQNDAAIRKEWNEFTDQLQKSDGVNWLSSLEENQEWERVKNKLKNTDKKPFRLSRNSTWKKVAAVAAILICGLVLWQTIFKPERENAPKISGLPKGVILQRWDGVSVSLDDKNAAGDSGALKNKSFVPDNDNSIHEITYNTIIVPPMADYKFQLPDGTTVWLNSDSKISIPSDFGVSARNVLLEGEGFFEVAKNKNLAFIVHAANTATKVFGTQFNISTYDSAQTTISLFSGSVSVTDKEGNEESLSPGFQVAYKEGIFKKEKFNMGEIAAWKLGTYIFENKPIEELAPVLKRWYGVDLKYPNALKNRRISGALYKKDPVQVFIDNISTSLNLKCQIDGNVIIIED